MSGKVGRPKKDPVDRLRGIAASRFVLMTEECTSWRALANKLDLDYENLKKMVKGTRSPIPLLDRCPSAYEVYKQGPYGVPLWAALRGDPLTDDDFHGRSQLLARKHLPKKLWFDLAFYASLYWDELEVLKTRRVHYEDNTKAFLHHAEMIDNTLDAIEFGGDNPYLGQDRAQQAKNIVNHFTTDMELPQPPWLSDYDEYEPWHSLSDFALDKSKVAELLPGLAALINDDFATALSELDEYKVLEYEKSSLR